MSTKSLLAISSAFIAVAAFAQAPMGVVEDVQGLVTVTDGATGGRAVKGNSIKSGMRFVTTSSGSAVLRLKNDCVIRLQPSQAVTVLESMDCRALLAAVQSLGSVNVAGGSFTTGALASGGLMAGSLALDQTLGKSKSLSSH